MIKEAYCSFEVAKLLKEKEFDEECYTFYEYDSKEFYREERISCCNSRSDDYAAPTQQMAMRWLRELHGIFIAINNDDLDFNWQCYDLINRGNTLDPKILSESYAGYKTYEQAVEAAIKYCLENLI